MGYLVKMGLIYSPEEDSYLLQEVLKKEIPSLLNKKKNLKFMEKQRKWSAWGRKDPNMDTKLTGIDGEVGAISYWNGNKDVGEGEQEITRIVERERAEGELRFLKPMKSQSDCYLILEEQTPGKNKVTWGFKGKSAFPFSLLMLFMSMDKMVGKDFEEGLRTLKSKMEQ